MKLANTLDSIDSGNKFVLVSLVSVQWWKVKPPREES